MAQSNGNRRSRRHPKRQATRRTILFVSFLLFPVTLNFLSPYVIVDGAFQGIVNGSFVLFGLMLFSSLFVGRLWCGWLCPAGGMSEACFMISDKRARGGRLNWIKWGIWIPWIGVIIFAVLSARGYKHVDLLHLTETGVSVDEPVKYITYYLVVGTILLLVLTAGKRAFCHYGCWMAPFMIIGRKLRNVLDTPALRLVVEQDKCVECRACNRACPMSLDVHGMVRSGSMENSECILCAGCVDTCPKQVIYFSFSRGSQRVASRR
jgi:polyferredoxin